jgi:early secretory antigenic target protein ESAT-6
MDLAIKVTPQQLQALSTRVASGAGHIESELGALQSTLAPLGADWAGAAQARFLALWQDWQSGARQVHDALTGISALLGQAGAAYADAEAAIASSFAAM